MKRSLIVSRSFWRAQGIAVIVFVILALSPMPSRQALTNDADSTNAAGAAALANFDCQFEATRHGLLQTTEIHLKTYSEPAYQNVQGITLASDDRGGARTWVSLPTTFDHGSGHTIKSDLSTSNGSFKVTIKVRLAGVKTFGIWRSKRNVVKLEVHEFSAAGPLVAQGILDRSVSSPSDYTFSTSFYSSSQPMSTFKTYYVMLYFDKYDNNGSNDGYCGMEIRVRSV